MIKIKKRYIILTSVLLLILLGSVIAFTRPVLPVIQLPGEVYPGIEIPFLGGLTNTFVATVVSYIILISIVLSVRARSRTADEVPTGLYNFFEMVVEGAYNFTSNIAGGKARHFFPHFMTFLLLILIANWLELVPGVDSIGFFENLAHFEAVQEVEETYAEEELSEEEREELVHELEEELDAQNIGALRVPPDSPIGFIVRAEGNVEGNSGFLGLEADPDLADWTIVPFLRAPATDLNFTLALSLVAMALVEYYGFRFLGLRYLKRFFNMDIDAMKKNPIKLLDPAVGILEFISEISRVISFAFRLLGNIFAGQVVLFVIAFLLPVANIAFFALELFVGFIQAAVFAMLSLIFMVGATTEHGDEEHH